MSANSLSAATHELENEKASLSFRSTSTHTLEKEEAIQRLVAEVQLRSKPWRSDKEIGAACRKRLDLEAKHEDRSFERWIPDPTVPASQCQFEKKGKNDWSQFKANEQLFGYVSTFNFDLYSTPLSKSLVSPEMQAAIELLVREIGTGSKGGE